MKKSQVSVFVILGLILLFSVVLFIYFKVTFTAKQPELLNDELQPVKSYVEECMSKSAGDAVRIIGQQGGFIKIPLNIDTNPSMYVSPDGLGVLKVPYWFYKGTRYSPTIASVQSQISDYVTENTGKCINNFEAFKEQYTIVELGKMKVITFLNKEDISLTMEYPIRIIYKSNNTQTTLNRFSANVDVRLRKILEKANTLLDSELRNIFLENFTIDLMASNPNIPFTDMKFTCDNLQWNILDVKKELEDMLFYNIPRIRVKNTNYGPFAEDESKYKKLLEYDMEDIANKNYPKDIPEDAYEYLHMFWDAGMQKDDTINIGLTFPRQIGIDIVGRPNDNGILKSQMAQGNKKYLSFMCINIYHFIYDVNYPVIVTLRDAASFAGDGYVFNFAMPVTIHNNEPYKGFYGYDLFTTTYYDRGFCEDRLNEITDIRALGKEAGYSNMEIEGVNISLECFKYYCNLGITKPDQGSYRLRTNLPSSCSNPFIIAEKEGYLKSKKQLDNRENFGISLTKLRKLDYSVVYHRYNSIGNIIESGQQPTENMNISIQISTTDLDQYKVYPIEDYSNEKISKVELIDGDAEYDLQLVLMDGEEYAGGYNSKWKVNAAAVANANEIVFHVIEYVPTPYTKEDKLKMMAYILEGNYKNQLKPELK